MSVFDIDARALPSSPRSADWCKRLDTNTNQGAGLAELGCSFGLVDDPSNDYSVPVWDDDRAPAARVFYRPGWPGHFIGKIGQKVPWRSSWHPSRGKDGHAAIRTTDDKGRPIEVDLWGLSSSNEQTVDRPQAGVLGNVRNWLVWPRFNANRDLVAATVVRTPLDGRTGDGFICAPLSQGVTTPEEVASGSIRHALRLALPCGMTGPAAPASYRDPDHPDIGVRYGMAALPCGIHEGVGSTGSPGTLARSVPHGLRVVGVDIDVDRWLDTGSSTGPTTRPPYRGTLRTTAATIAEAAAVTHGLVAVISTPADAADTHVQFDGSRPDAWRDLGIDGDGRELLHGLFDGPGTIRAIDWPTAKLPDGTTTNRATVDVAPAYSTTG